LEAAVLNNVSRSLFDAYSRARASKASNVTSVTEFSTEFRAGNKPVTVVLLPALFVGDWLWDPVWTHLTQAGWPAIRFPEAVTLVDRRTARSIGRLSTALLRACRRHTTGPLVVCGDSLGALMAMEFGKLYPGDTLGLAVSGAPGLDRAASQLGRELLIESRDAREVADRFLARLLYEPERCRIDQTRYAALVDELATAERVETMLAGLQAIRGCNVRTLLPTLPMPKLFIWGRQDEITPLAPWETMVQKLPDARLVVLDQCGHAPMFERPDEFFRELSMLLSVCVDGVTTA
jgi:pimeloyl-ACP methyl ester carboxylesterase